MKINSSISNNTFSTQDLFYNQNTSKDEALQRAKEPIFVNVTKAEDGTITFDRQQLSQEEVLSLKESDLKKVDVNWGSLKLQLAGTDLNNYVLNNQIDLLDMMV